MNKYEYITELMELFDKLDALKRENDDLRNVISRRFSDCMGDGDLHSEVNPYFATLDYHALQLGRAEMFATHFYVSDGVNARREKNGEVTCTSFDTWVERAYKRTPEFTSKNDFLEYMRPVLMEKYRERKEEAIDQLISSELDNESESESDQ